MDDFFQALQQELQKDIKAAAKESSDWLAAVSQETSVVVEQWMTNSLEVVEEIDEALAPTLIEINERMDQAVESSFLFVDQQVMPWVEEKSAPITHTVNPWLQNHTACIGCKHYHGTQYGNEMLVCAMHPYGAEEESCRDWDSVWSDV